MNPSPVRRPLVRRDDGKLTGPPRRRRCPSPRDDPRRHSCHARGTHSKSLQMTGNADRPRSIRFENLMNRCDRARDEPVRVNCHGIFHPVDTNKLHTLISPRYRRIDWMKHVEGSSTTQMEMSPFRQTHARTPKRSSGRIRGRLRGTWNRSSTPLRTLTCPKFAFTPSTFAVDGWRKRRRKRRKKRPTN